jgi:hypothetical protein
MDENPYRAETGPKPKRVRGRRVLLEYLVIVAFSVIAALVVLAIRR